MSKLAELATKLSTTKPTPPGQALPPAAAAPPASLRLPGLGQPAKILHRAQSQQEQEQQQQQQEQWPAAEAAVGSSSGPTAGEGASSGGASGAPGAGPAEEHVAVQLSVQGGVARLAAALLGLSLSTASPRPAAAAVEPRAEYVTLSLSVQPGGTPGGDSSTLGAPNGTAEGEVDAAARSLRLAFSSALSFVEDSLQIPSIATRPDALTALASVLRRWLGVAAVLEGRGAAGELARMWRETQAALLLGPASAVARIRCAGMRAGGAWNCMGGIAAVRAKSQLAACCWDVRCAFLYT